MCNDVTLFWPEVYRKSVGLRSAEPPAPHCAAAAPRSPPRKAEARGAYAELSPGLCFNIAVSLGHAPDPNTIEPGLSADFVSTSCCTRV